MNRVLTMIFLIFSFYVYGTERVVVAELFTNTGCSPCVSANARLTQLSEMYPLNLAIIRYHMNWPSSSDPFYLANPMENLARRRYYFNFNYVPHLVVDGDTLDAPNGYSMGYQTRIQNELSNPSPIDMTLEVQYDTLTRTGTIYYKAKATDNVPQTNLRLRTAITQSYIYYTGSNGDPVHHQVMRDMIPDTIGISVNLVSPPDSVYGSIPFTISSNWNVDNIEIVSFIQTDNIVAQGNIRRKPVYQGSKFTFSPRLKQFNDTIIEISGNNNGYVDPGETGGIIFYVKNLGGYGDSLNIQLMTGSPYVNILNNLYSVPSIQTGEVVSNESSPLTFMLSGATPEGEEIKFFVKKEVISRMTKHIITKYDTITYYAGTPSYLFDEGFETGLGGWVIGGNNNVFWSSTVYHWGSHSAVVGVPSGTEPNGDDWMYREVNIPSDVDKVLLNCWVKRGTYDVITYNWQNLEILNTSNSILQTLYHTCVNDVDWKNFIFDLSSYMGQTIRIRFLTREDGYGDNTWQYVDDVRLLTYKTTGIKEDIITFDDFSNIIYGESLLKFTLKKEAFIKIKIYDIAGKKIMERNEKYERGEHYLKIKDKINNGVYFVQFEYSGFKNIRKVLVIR